MVRRVCVLPPVGGRRVGANASAPHMSICKLRQTKTCIGIGFSFFKVVSFEGRFARKTLPGVGGVSCLARALALV